MAPNGTGRVLLVAMLAATSGHAAAQSPERPRLETNQSYVEEVTRATALAIDDPMAVFAFVLAALPEQVKVYPTENYYYFRFSLNGARYAGDVRLDAGDRDQGKLHFGYYEEMAEWKREGGIDIEIVLDASRGVTVTRLEHLAYRVSYGGKSVIFALNDLSQEKPAALAGDEKFVGRIFDESAIRFDLLYNSTLKIFHYILDETAPVVEEFMPAKRGDRIIIGKRTGFAFYRDQRIERKILIGVFAANTRINNYFDGPFDQLPENFIEGQALYDLIVDADPAAKGKIDRLGHYLDGSGRYSIHPYMLYRNESEFDIVRRCASSKRISAANYYACFAFDADNIDAPNRRPLAMVKGSSPSPKSGGSGRR
jgi:hypothetical protein